MFIYIWFLKKRWCYWATKYTQSFQKQWDYKYNMNAIQKKIERLEK